MESENSDLEAMESPSPLRICIVQMDIAWENPGKNWSHIGMMLREEVGKHDLVILPEMFSTGFTMQARQNAEPVDESESVAWMQFQAAKLGVVIMGSVIIEEEGLFYNRLLVVDQDGVVLKYDKRHLFRMAGEHEVFAAGSEMQILMLKGWRICPLVCYDLRFPVWSRNSMNPDGRLWYDVLVYVANWPERRAAHWKALLPARAIENQAWVAGVNRVGTDANDIVYSGDSMLCDPQGNVVLHKTKVEGLLAYTLDWEGLSSYREKFPAWSDADRFEIYG
jgi:omega-amidase